ncbi:MAG: hypothetical protein PHV20_10725 [Bacteroidales bacterium]|nr:hypothetical protein [Bacteroidales bacterium]
MGYHFMPKKLYSSLFFAFFAFGPWLLMLYFLDKLEYENGILTVFTFWGFKKRSFGRDEIVGWSEEMIKEELKLKIHLVNNKRYTISSSLYKNYAELRKVLIHGKSKIKIPSKSHDFITFVLISGFGLFFLLLTIPSFVKADNGIESVETVLIHSNAISVKKESSKSSHWIEIYLKDYPGFSFQVEDEAYKLIDDKVLEEVQQGDTISIEISKADYQHCQKDMHSGYVWKEGDSEENMSVYAVKGSFRTYLRSVDYWHEKEAAAKETPWVNILLGLVFFFGGFYFILLKDQNKTNKSITKDMKP